VTVRVQVGVRGGALAVWGVDCELLTTFFSGFAVHDLGVVDEKIDFLIETRDYGGVYVVVVVVILFETGFDLVVVFSVVF
jgi:hypothetical protein